MRIFCYLLLLFIIVINLGYPQCAGDVNLDNTVDGADVFIIVNHIFDTDPIEGDGFNNGDINGTTTIDIYDLVAIVNITLLPEDDCAGFLPIDLSLDWQIQEDPSYFDFEVLDEIVNEEIAQLQYIRGIIVIHQGKIVSEQPEALEPITTKLLRRLNRILNLNLLLNLLESVAVMRDCHFLNLLSAF